VAATRVSALNQLVAVRKGVQPDVHTAITALHRESQKVPLLSGLTRKYRKIRDEDADLPGESQPVQVRLTEVLDQVRAQYTRLWDVTAAVDWTNCTAVADVVVGDETVVAAAPVSFLIFLEKQLVDLHTIVARLPVLDPAERWHWDGNATAWATETTTTVRTKKELRNHVVAPATDKHPAQVQTYPEDVPVGYWDVIKFSGALPGATRAQLLDRITVLREAVKIAREKANMTAAVDPKPAAGVFNFLYALRDF
jgi:hypothetical protein